MSSQKPTVTKATTDDYANVFRRLFGNAKKNSGHEDPLDVIDWMIADEIRLKPTKSKNTFRQYKAAISHVLRSYLQSDRRTERQRSRLASALERIAGQSSTGGLSKTNRTSAQKSKSVGEMEFGTMHTHLASRVGKHKWAQATLSAMHLMHLSGLRPCELGSLQLAEPEPGTFVLLVHNAKHTNGRGNGPTRTVELTGLTSTEVDQVRAWPGLRDEIGHSIAIKIAIDRIRRYFGRQTEKVLPRRPKHITAYSLRHQFTADCKKSGVSEADRAALLGHASNYTATIHYGRQVGGNAGVKAKASPSESANVRNKARRFPGRDRGPKPGA